MVRLVPAQCKLSLRIHDEEFQSHNGSIGTFKFLLFQSYVAVFQSHNGSIGTRITTSPEGDMMRFNPTMVRLVQFAAERNR